MMWTVIGILSLCWLGSVNSLPNSGGLARSRSQPEARMQMSDLLAPAGTSGSRPTCMHDGRWYYERSVIPTVDSCINCKCENGMVRCNMTLCPMYPNVQEGCQLLHEDGSCCPQLVCNENVAKKLSSVPEIHDATLLGCTYNDFEFGLGDFIPTSDPCQACYCIHNRTQCVHQNCALPESAREGCRPVYHHGICCPIRYDCAEALAVPPTQRPAFTSEGCAVNNKLYDEGEAIVSGKPCEHCYCMKGEMICAMQKCDTPMAGCAPVIKEGQCCPERFECPNLTTTPPPWNNSGVVFSDPAATATTKRKINLNITIETAFPRDPSQQLQQRYSSTTRALDDDVNDPLGDLQHTTSPTVTTTSPSSPAVSSLSLVSAGSQVQNDSTLAVSFGLPTALPTAAQLGFSGNRSAQLTMRINGSQTINSSGRRLPPRAPGLSSPWLPSDNLQSTSTGSNPDVLQYTINQDGSVPVSAAEILNSGSPLGTRPPGDTTVSTLIILPANSLGSTNGNSNDHAVGLFISSSSDSKEIALNSKLNVTSGGSFSSNGAVAVSINGTTVALVPGSKLIASASGNSSVRAVLLPAPIDPSLSDPSSYEGFIRSPPRPPSNRTRVNMVAVDPENNAEIEGAASVSNPGDKLVVQVPGAHLTDYGLATASADPSIANQFEGQTSVRNGDKPIAQTVQAAGHNFPVDPSKSTDIEGALSTLPVIRQPAPGSLKPTDPASPAEVEGWWKSAPTGAIQIGNGTSNGDTSTAVDPTTHSQVESVSAGKTSSTAAPPTTATSTTPRMNGALSVSNPGSKIPIPSVPLDSESLAMIDVALNAAREAQAKRKAQAVQKPPIDPIDNQEVEGALNFPNTAPARPTVTAVLIPIDPSKTVEIEGALRRQEAPATSAAQNISLVAPADPTNTSIINGSLTTLPAVVVSIATTTTTASKLEGSLKMVTPKPQTAAVGGAPVDPTKPSEIEGLLPAAPKVPTVQPPAFPVDPTKAAEIEGALSTLPVIRPASPGSLKPTDPAFEDQFEGVLALQPVALQPVTLQPVTPQPVALQPVTLQPVALQPVVQPAVTVAVPLKPENLTASGQNSGGGASTEAPIVVVPVAVKKPESLVTITRSGGSAVAGSQVAIDPISAGDVEGVLAWHNPIRKVADGVLHPFDPVTSDRFEGALPANFSAPILKPVEPSKVDSVAGLAKPQPHNPLDPEPSDNAEGVWDWNAFRQTNSPTVAVPIAQTAATTTAQPVPVITQTTQAPLSVVKQAQTLDISGAASLSDQSNVTAISTGSQNGTVPANFMMAAGATHDSTSTDSNVTTTTQLPVNLLTSVTESKVIHLPVDPEVDDEVEGQPHHNFKLNWATHPSIDPLPSDGVEGAIERPNDASAAPAASDTTTKTPWTIYTNQHSDSSVSRWVIRTQNPQTAQVGNGRNITWVQGTDSQMPVLVLSSSTTTRIPDAASSVDGSTTTTSSPLPPVTNSTAGPSDVTSTVSSSTAAPSTTTVDLAASVAAVESTTTEVPSVPIVNLGNLDKLPNMRVKENRRASTTTQATTSAVGFGGDADATSPPVWAGSLGSSLTLSNGSIPVQPAFEPGAPLTGIYLNGCFYDGAYYRNYQSVPTGDLVDPCLVRLCKDGVILGPSEQRCPPPIEGCFSTSIPGVCCPVYLCPNYLERNETSYTLTAATGDTLNTEKTKLALAKFCRVGPRFLALNERVVHVVGGAVQCQTCTCKPKGIVCEPGCAQGILITTEIPAVISPRIRFATLSTTPATTLPSTVPPVTEPAGARSCVIHKKRFHHGDEVNFNDPCHICTCMDGLVICKINRRACRNAKLLSDSDAFF
ncbi:hypothetical protein BV898_00839 [Hypsibius exemplaris]|uniref:VWFC domain-containing protein n=1 Tax=Hypsibius exemplaris TaxID=2072580 RepID=A0A1W0XCE0_HYPEX|nr:hypothetical protein BV898_00839 [Hypsibius exemplaris]